jgi:hypothetical protein
MYNSRFKLLCFLTAWMAAAAVSNSGFAQQPAQSVAGLKDQIPLLAAQIKQYLTQDAKSTEVEVKRFECGPEIPASAGSAIQTLLSQELTKLGITQKAGAPHSCTGEYTFVEQESKVLIETSIVGNGAIKGKYGPIETRIAEVEDIVVLAGGTGKLAVNNPEQRKQDVIAAVQGVPATGSSPPGGAVPGGTVLGAAVPGGLRKIGLVNVNGTLASAGPESPYAIEVCILDRQSKQYVPVSLEDDEGFAYAPLNISDVYALRIYNRSKHAAAVNINIDGLNLFTISEFPDYKSHGKIIIPPGPAGFLLRGWHINDVESAEFEVASLPNSLIAQVTGAKLVNLAEVATITATFAAAIAEGEAPPPDEPEIRSLATKVGARFGQTYKPVHMRFGKVREVVSVRYDRKSPATLPPGGDVAGPPAAVSGAAPPAGPPVAK